MRDVLYGAVLEQGLALVQEIGDNHVHMHAGVSIDAAFVTLSLCSDCAVPSRGAQAVVVIVVIHETQLHTSFLEYISADSAPQSLTAMQCPRQATVVL